MSHIQDFQQSVPVITTRDMKGVISPFPGRIMTWEAQGGSASISIYGGFGTSTLGTASIRTVTTANLVTSMRRLAYVTSALAGNGAGTRHALNQFWRGNADHLGGFLYITRFMIDTAVASMRWFVGFTDAAAIGNVNPSTLLNLVGFGIDSGQTTVRFFNNDGVGAATSTDLGASFPATNIAEVYESRIWCAPNGATIRYSLERLGPPNFFVEGSVTTDIPISTALICPQIWVNNGPTAAAAAIAVVSQYVETFR